MELTGRGLKIFENRAREQEEETMNREMQQEQQQTNEEKEIVEQQEQSTMSNTEIQEEKTMNTEIEMQQEQIKEQQEEKMEEQSTQEKNRFSDLAEVKNDLEANGVSFNATMTRAIIYRDETVDGKSFVYTIERVKDKSSGFSVYKLGEYVDGIEQGINDQKASVFTNLEIISGSYRVRDWLTSREIAIPKRVLQSIVTIVAHGVLKLGRAVISSGVLSGEEIWQGLIEAASSGDERIEIVFYNNSYHLVIVGRIDGQKPKDAFDSLINEIAPYNKPTTARDWLVKNGKLVCDNLQKLKDGTVVGGDYRKTLGKRLCKNLQIRRGVYELGSNSEEMRRVLVARGIIIIEDGKTIDLEDYLDEDELYGEYEGYYISSETDEDDDEYEYEDEDVLTA